MHSYDMYTSYASGSLFRVIMAITNNMRMHVNFVCRFCIRGVHWIMTGAYGGAQESDLGLGGAPSSHWLLWGQGFT